MIKTILLKINIRVKNIKKNVWIILKLKENNREIFKDYFV